MVRRSTTSRADEELGVAIAAGDWRGKDADIPAAERGCERGDVVADFLMYRRVTDDSALGMFSRSLKLRLDQREKTHRGCRKRQCNRKHELERDEADVDYDDIGPRGEALALKAPDIGLLHGNDFWMIAQSWVQLGAPDVDGENHTGAVG